MERLLVVSSSPHIHSPLDTQKVMGWVLAALAPAGLAGVYFFGFRAAIVMAVCVVSCVLFEYLWEKALKKPSTVNDLSAAVTGLLLAYNLPPTIPFWMAVLGSLFSMIVVKHLFGGLGCNIVNPALAGRAMMLTSWPVPMTTWTIDGVSGPTPLALIKMGAVDKLPSMQDLFIGHVGGCIGETSAIALLIGFGILLWKDIIKWHIPVVYVATVRGAQHGLRQAGQPALRGAFRRSAARRYIHGDRLRDDARHAPRTDNLRRRLRRPRDADTHMGRLSRRACRTRY